MASFGFKLLDELGQFRLLLADGVPLLLTALSYFLQHAPVSLHQFVDQVALFDVFLVVRLL